MPSAIHTVTTCASDTPAVCRCPTGGGSRIAGRVATSRSAVGPDFSPVDPPDPVVDVPVGEAVGGWVIAWLSGGVLATLIALSSGSGGGSSSGPWVVLALAVAQWTPFVVLLVAVGRRRGGTGRPDVDFGLRWRPVDLVGVPLGVVTQLVVVPAVYVPLARWWPTTFETERVERRARDLWESSSGTGIIALVVVVVIGAPLVEELVYRGLLQRSLVRRAGPFLGVTLATVWFALIHVQPVEYPGLLLAGAAFGIPAVVTGRLGASVLAHVAFNAAGLAVVAAG